MAPGRPHRATEGKDNMARHTDPGDIDLGWAEISPDRAYAKEPGTWEITYHCGPTALTQRARVRVFPPFTFDNAHNSCVRWQTGTLTVRTDADADLSVKMVDTFPVAALSVNYTIDVIEVTLDKGRITGGQSLTVVMGDCRNDGEPAVAQWLSGPDMPFHVSVAADGEGDFRPLVQYPRIRVYGSRPERLVCIAPPTVDAGEPFALRVKAEDAHTNISSLYQSPLHFTPEEGMTGPGLSAVSLYEEGQKQVPGFSLSSGGTRRLTVSDGRMSAQSSPVSTEFTRKGERIYWGEIHAHVELGDGVGSEDRYYQYARDEAWLDFSAISEHGGGRDWWSCCIEAAERHYEPGKFATLLGYERAWGGGHANIYSRDLDLPVVTSKEREKVFSLIREGNAIMIPHHTSDPLVNGVAIFKWDDVDKDLIHAAEICQMRGSFEKDQLGDHVLFAGYGCSIQDALGKGFRFGFTGGTDNHCGRPASPMVVAFHPGTRVGSGEMCDLTRTWLKRNLCGITAVFAGALTREAVFDAIRTRRSYATTGARILLDFEVNDLRMGEQGKIKKPAEIRVRVAGTAPLAWISIVRNNEDVLRVMGEGLDQEVLWEDADVTPGSWYYARVVQEDGHMAWASPVWLD